MAIWASGDKVIPAKLNIGQPVGVNGFAVTSGTDTTTSATYVNLAGTGSQTSVSITKLNASTRIRVEMALSVYSAGGVRQGLAGVLVNGVDYDVCTIATSTASERMLQSGTVRIAGLAAGTYTVQGRWKATGGAGTYTRDAADWLMIEATEVP